MDTISPVYHISVDLNGSKGNLPHIWRSIGYDEINWTYTPTGKLIFTRLANLSDAPYFVRNHNALTSGNSLSYPAWGSTNVYTEDEQGNPIYHWETIDKIYDVMTAANCVPLIELGFMPRALAQVPPEAYRNGNSLAIGLYDPAASYPPRDFSRWKNLISQFTQHCLDRYGAQVLNWRFELWNEPDLTYYWMGGLEGYCTLYDYTAAGLKSVDARLKLGGPAVAFGVEFLDGFLAHCENGVNAATGEKGAPLDFIAFHLKGTHWPAPGMPVQPSWQQMKRMMGRFCQAIHNHPSFLHLPVYIDECDIDVGTIQGIYDNPSLEFRNNEYYATFLCRLSKLCLDAAKEFQINLELITTWAFYFEGKRAFEGNRTLFDYAGLEKPVFQAFRLLSQMGSERLSLEVEETGGMSCELDGMASQAAEGTIAVVLWNFVEDQTTKAIVEVKLRLENLPRSIYRLLHYRIDDQHSNSYTKWKGLGSPEYPTEAQLNVIAASQGLELYQPPRQVEIQENRLDLSLELPAHSVSLILLKP